MHISVAQEHAEAHGPHQGIAVIGCDGKHPQNCERDFHRLVRAEEPMLKALPVVAVDLLELRPESRLGVRSRKCHIHLARHLQAHVPAQAFPLHEDARWGPWRACAVLVEAS